MPGVEKLSFLIVDDEAVIVQALELFLMKLGAENIKTAIGGKQAIDIVGQEGPSPDVIFLDMSMPEMSGPDVLDELVARDFAGRVVLVSAVDQETLEYAKGFAMCRDVSVLGYIQKPLAFERFKEALEDFGILETDRPEPDQEQEIYVPGRGPKPLIAPGKRGPSWFDKNRGTA